MKELSRLLDAGLEDLSAKLYRMAEIAERTVETSIRGFLEGLDCTEKVKASSDILVKMSVDIEDKVFELISKYQPVASDLRIIKSYMKIGYDLERYGRYAWDISFIHKRLANSRKCIYQETMIKEMTETVMEMINISVNALKSHNAEMAKTLAKIEDEVDRIYFRYLDTLGESQAETKCVITNLLVVRYLERIADHAAYIGESIIYIATSERVTLR